MGHAGFLISAIPGWRRYDSGEEEGAVLDEHGRTDPVCGEGK